MVSATPETLEFQLDRMDCSYEHMLFHPSEPKSPETLSWQTFDFSYKIQKLFNALSKLQLFLSWLKVTVPVLI